MAILDNLENIGKSIAEKSKEAAKKAKDLTEVMSLKAQISTEKNMIQDLYTRIGKKYFDENKYGQHEEYAEFFDKIQTGLDKVALLEQEINSISGLKKCLSCGVKISSEASFCSSCGSKLEQEEAQMESLRLETGLHEEEASEEDTSGGSTVSIREESVESETGKVNASIVVEEREAEGF